MSNPKEDGNSAIVISSNTAFTQTGFGRVNDDEHFRRAMLSDRPHSYIAERSGRVKFAGEEGIGAVNAETLHVRVMRSEGYIPDSEDMAAAHRMTGGSLMGGLKILRRQYPETYERFFMVLPQEFAIPEPRSRGLNFM